MANEPGILKNPVLKHDQDYSYLIESGREYIAQLGSALWTDYNEHDPGITILEALCYAITELGYRTAFPMKDLLTQNDGTIVSSQTLFTAKKILTQSPLNKNDYRKLLIDVEGVQNAWLFAHSHYKDENGNMIFTGEQPIYADNKLNELTYNPTALPVYLRGLYKVLLDLDEDPQLGDLNNGEININVIISTGETVELTIVFPAWNSFDSDLFAIDIHNLPTLTFSKATDDQLQFSISFSFRGKTYLLPGKVIIGLQPSSGALHFADINNIFLAHSNAIVEKLTRLFLSKIIKAHNIVRAAISKLYKHRNLCEDFVSIETITDEEIAFCFDVDVVPDVDIEEVEANILFVIQQYLDPDVKFYLLSEMRQKINSSTNNLYTIDEIFEGPKLKHGFIDTTELENTNLRTEIYASEIITDIMKIKINGEKVVLAVRNFKMTAYDDKEQIITSEANQNWCIKINKWRKPVLAKDKSKIVLYKNDIPFLPRQKETEETLQWLESMQARQKLISKADDINIPKGKYFSFDTYTSVQKLFPKTYAIGDNPLLSTATDERKAQARQLKAYLLFYDQLLADFFMQLKNAEQLFSTNNIKQTYFAQFVNDFYDSDSIYIKDSSNNYLLKKNVIDSQDSSVAPPSAFNDWENLYESNETFVDRRNRFLDHLMARFAESFNEYVFMMYSLDNTTQQETKIDAADLINSKIKFLQNYPKTSYHRAKAFNYCPLDKKFNLKKNKLWNTDNVSGLETKLCMLGGFADPGNGMKNYYRRFLRCIGSGNIELSIQPVTTGSTASYKFSLTSGDFLLTSSNYSTLNLLNADIVEFINNSATISFAIVASPGGFIVQLTVNGNVIQSNEFHKKNIAQKAFHNFTADLQKSSCSNEGLYLIEHILLRPRTNEYLLAPVCIDDNCESCCDDDPYSFSISVVLPYWASHFNNMNFRNYFEGLAREEAPAHCMVKVCWINADAMLQFEICYCTWIQAMAMYYSNESLINKTFLKDANNNLLAILGSLHSEYPVATLHDCDESKDTNPVILGKTVLGTLNTQVYDDTKK